MARIRTIKPTFFRSRAVRRLSSSDVKLVWVGLWPLADDEGRLMDEAELLAGDMWALSLEVDQIEAALTELHERGRIVRYEANGDRFIQVTNWHDHQRIQKPNPSEIPPVLIRDESGTTTGTVSVGREGKGIGREGSDINIATTPFCDSHPKGTDKACRACGNARRAFDAALLEKKNKPTPSPRRDVPTAATCKHKYVAGWCVAGCEGKQP